MKPTKKILVIDDESQKNDMERIVNGVKSVISVFSKQIEVLGSEFLDNEAHWVRERFEAAVESELNSHYDLVLVDYDYGNEQPINGLDVINLIRQKRKNIAIVLYSADQKTVIKNVIGHDLRSSSESDIVNGVNKLMDYKIAKMCRRDAYVTDVIGMLKANIAPSPKALLCEMLRKNGDRVFSSCCPSLTGKTFREIADALDEDNNGKAHEWLKAILEQVMVYLEMTNE